MKFLRQFVLASAFCSAAFAQEFGRWTPLPPLPLQNFEPLSAFRAFQDDLFVGTEKGKVFVSRNGGLSWTDITGNWPLNFVMDFAAIGPHRFVGVFGAGIFKLADNGTTWALSLPGSSTLGSFESAVLNNCLYATASVTAESRIARTCDFGQSWQPVTIPQTGNEYYFPAGIIAVGGRLAVGAIGRIHVSDETGGNWQARNLPDLSNRPTSFAVVGPYLIVNIYIGYMVRTRDLGQTWEDVPEDFVEPSGFATIGNTLFTNEDYGAFASADFGDTWTAVSGGLPRANYYILAAKGVSLYVALSSDEILRNDGPFPNMAILSAASFRSGQAAPNSIAALFGSGLASGSAAATVTPLPTNLNGTAASVKDAAGVIHQAPLFFVSPGQVNFQVPTGAATGKAVVSVRLDGEGVGICEVEISSVAPGIFTANSDGAGPPSGLVLRARGASQTYEPTAAFDAASGKFVPAAIDLGPAGDQLSLILFGTGIRNRFSLSQVTARVGGTSLQVLYAGPTPGFVGLDQINLALPADLRGAGLVDVGVTVQGRIANKVQIRVQ